MASNYSGIAQSTLDMVAHSLATSELSFADLICTQNSSKTTLQGSFPVRTKLLSRGENGGLARGVEAKTKDMGADKVIYDCLAYIGEVDFFEEDEIDWDAFGESEATEAGKQARADANIAIDLKLEEILTSASLNETFVTTSDGNGRWSDGGTASTPLDDLQAIKVLYPDLDMIAFGTGTERYLASHPDFIAEVSHINAGQLDFAGVASVLARKLGLDPANIFVARDRFYNSAADGAAEVVTNLLENELFFGKRANLHMINPRHVRNGELRFFETEKQRKITAQLKRYIDIKRSGGTNRGVVVQNIGPA